MSRLKATPMKRVKYPTGMVVRKCVYQNESGTLRVYVEQIVQTGENALGVKAGMVWVSGTLIPKGATGVCCHETLPTGEFYPKSYANPMKEARKLARKMFKRFAPEAA